MPVSTWDCPCAWPPIPASTACRSSSWRWPPPWRWRCLDGRACTCCGCSAAVFLIFLPPLPDTRRGHGARRAGAAQHIRRPAVDPGIGVPHAAQPGGALLRAVLTGGDERPRWWFCRVCPRRFIMTKTRASAAMSPIWPRRQYQSPAGSGGPHAARRAAQLRHSGLAGRPPGHRYGEVNLCHLVTPTRGPSISSNAFAPKRVISRRQTGGSLADGQQVGAFHLLRYSDFVRDRSVADGAEVLLPNISKRRY